MGPVEPSHSKCFGETPSNCTTLATQSIRAYRTVPHKSHVHQGSNCSPQGPLGKRDYCNYHLLFECTLLAHSEIEW